MEIYRTIVENKKLYKTSAMNDWALATLTEEQYKQFQQDEQANIALWESYEKEGKYTRQPIYETVYSTILNSNIEIWVGEEMIMTPGVTFNDLNVFRDWSYWVDRYVRETGDNSQTPILII